MKKINFAVVLLTIAIGGPMTVYAASARKMYEEYAAWEKTLPEAGADYGAEPTNYEELIKRHLAEALKDPDSVKYSTFSAPRKGYAIRDTNVKKATYGYSVCAYVNAKNSYGGYTGNHMFWFFISNDIVVLSRDMTASNFLRLIYRDDLSKCLEYDYSVK